MASPHPLSWADAPPYHYHGTTPQPAPDSSTDRPRSLWIGGLLHWMDEDYLYACFTTSPEVRPAPPLRFDQSTIYCCAVCSIIIRLVLVCGALDLPTQFALPLRWGFLKFSCVQFFLIILATTSCAVRLGRNTPSISSYASSQVVLFTGSICLFILSFRVAAAMH